LITFDSFEVTMRLPLAVLLSAVAFAAAAQSTARPRPPGTTPLDVPPPPPITASATEVDDAAESVRRAEGPNGQVIEEYRGRGRLHVQRVTPRHGRAYVLADPKTDGSLTKLDNSIDGHLAVPQWVLLEF
jgi:hypothetical protein